MLGIVDVKIKKLRDNAIVPVYQTDGSAGFDFYAAIDSPRYIGPGDWVEIPFGIAMEIPPGYELRIRSRSGLAFKHKLIAYHGLVDSDFRGELSVLLHNAAYDKYVVQPGERIAQGVISKYDIANFILTDELSETARGENGFGSTGKH